MTVSVIIAVKAWDRNLEECAAKCRNLDYPDFEIIILPDNPMPSLRAPQGRSNPVFESASSPEPALTLNEVKGNVTPRNDNLVRIIPTGPISPARKRDMAMNYAKGEILAFIDDDAYPEAGWLKNAIDNFNDPQVAAVGGPAITPESDNLRQKAGGLVYSSPLVSAGYAYRYRPGEKREVDDYPSCNFLVRKSIMRQLNGFNTDFWPGEDTKFCLDITGKLGKKIIYDPRAVVYHHRRPLFLPHLKQTAAYALHRGYFVKKYPETSRRLSYFVPALFLSCLIAGGALSVFSSPFRMIYSLGLFLYLFTILVFSLSKGLGLAFLVFPGIISTHLTYGFYFLKGFLSRRLKEEL